MNRTPNVSNPGRRSVSQHNDGLSESRGNANTTMSSTSIQDDRFVCIRRFAPDGFVQSIDKLVKEGFTVDGNGLIIFESHLKIKDMLEALSHAFVSGLPAVMNHTLDRFNIPAEPYGINCILNTQTVTCQRVRIERFHTDDNQHFDSTLRHIVFSLSYVITGDPDTTRRYFPDPFTHTTHMTRIKATHNANDDSFVSCDKDAKDRQGATFFNPLTTMHRGMNNAEMHCSRVQRTGTPGVLEKGDIIRLSMITQFHVPADLDVVTWLKERDAVTWLKEPELTIRGGRIRAMSPQRRTPTRRPRRVKVARVTARPQGTRPHPSRKPHAHPRA